MEKKHVKTLSSATLKESAAKGGCGECQTSCQSACKTSCTVAMKIYIGVITMTIANNIYMLKIRGGNSYEE